MYVCMYACMHVCMYVCMCSPVSCLRSAVQHRACVRSTLLCVISFFLQSGDVECMTAAELANSHACALPTPGRLDGGGRRTRKEPAHTAAVQTHVCGEHERHVLSSAVRHCACSALCSPEPCLRSAVQHRACVRSTLFCVISFFLRSGDVECMTAAELANSHACALTTPGRLDGVERGHEKSRHTRLRCRHMCVVNTSVTCCALLCGTARVPRCVHPYRVCAVLCNTELVCAARSYVSFPFSCGQGM